MKPRKQETDNSYGKLNLTFLTLIFLSSLTDPTMGYLDLNGSADRDPDIAMATLESAPELF